MFKHTPHPPVATLREFMDHLGHEALQRIPPYQESLMQELERMEPGGRTGPKVRGSGITRHSPTRGKRKRQRKAQKQARRANR